jgi:CoA:oxalate CoA-transferase
MADAQYAARGSFAEIEDGAGPFLVPNPPFQLSRGGAAARGAVPGLGEHSRAVLGEVLGLPGERVSALCADGIVGDGPSARRRAGP